jgi:hypothetical protein
MTDAQKLKILVTFIEKELKAMRNLVASYENDKDMKPFALITKGRIARYVDLLESVGCNI